MLTEDSAVTTNGTSTCTNKENPPVLNMSLQFLISEESGTGNVDEDVTVCVCVCVCVCGEVTDADIVTEVLNNNIQTEDGASGNEEDTSSLSVCGLPEKEYSGYLEPYLVVQVMKSTWPLHRRAGAPLFYLRTRTIRHTHNPQFHQTFVLDAAKTHIKDWCMKMTVYDQDRFANHTELCVLNLPLKDIKLLNSNPNPIELSYNLMQSEKEFGELLIGICYLPTAQRLSFSIIKAINLKFLEITESIDKFYPYVRVIQLNGTSARAVKKKKTAYKHATESPNFNETLTFDLAPSQLETATFLVTVSNKNMEEAQDGCKKIKDTCLGKLALGRHVRRIAVKEHWIVVAENPRRTVGNHYGKTTLNTPDRDSNLDFPVIGSIVYCQGSTLDHAATKVGMYHEVVHHNNKCHLSHTRDTAVTRYTQTPDSLTHPQTRRPARWSLWLTHLTRRSTQITMYTPVHTLALGTPGLISREPRTEYLAITERTCLRPPPAPPSSLIPQSSEKVAAYLLDKDGDRENKERSQGKQ
uniref:(California timema) hypothetical protein n=1 Tax=Timema californicum TaxID=61474 RepID=A0A7R9PCE7_TIMCA|nr:unnamed protein product [Timema californicum]